MIDIENVWANIIKYEGQEFKQIRGQKFTYKLTDSKNALIPSTTNQVLSKTVFEDALAFMPLTSTKEIQHLRGPSYLFAILTDKRISGGAR